MYDRNTFYVTESPGGHVDYAFCDEFLAGGHERSCWLGTRGKNCKRCYRGAGTIS